MLEGLRAAVARIDYSKAKREARLFQNPGADDADGIDSQVQWRCRFEGRSNSIRWLTGWGWGGRFESERHVRKDAQDI